MGQASALVVEEERYAEALVLRPLGRIDAGTWGEFEALLKAKLGECMEHQGFIVIDFGKVEYLSSMGLRGLASASKESKKQNTVIVVADLTSFVQELFRISHFDKILPIYDTTDAAFAEISTTALAALRAAKG